MSLLLCRNIFTDSGVEWKNYRYFDPKTVGLDFKGMTEDLRNAPDGSVVVLHGENFSAGTCVLPEMLISNEDYCQLFHQIPEVAGPVII